MNDYIKTIFLLGSLTVLLVLIGGYLGGRDGLIFAFIFSLLMNGAAYFFSDKIALQASGAKPVSQTQAPELFQIVEDISRQLQMPMPKLFVMPATQANAFATGRDPGHASVAVTQGLMNLLTPEQIKGVLAHELGHVKNRDILISSVAAVLASSIAFLGQMSIYGGVGNGENRDRGMGGFGILLILLAPLAATIIRMAVSRDREFEADETGAEVLGTGEPLAQALQTIDKSARLAPMKEVNPAFASLYIANPFGGFGGSMLNLFSTHPPTEERVRRLRTMHF